MRIVGNGFMERTFRLDDSERGVKRIFLETERPNERARRLYARHGYQADDSQDEDTDLAVTARGGIAVTPLHLDLTHRDTMKRMRGIFD